MKIGTGMAWEKRIWVGFTDDISLDVEVVPSEEDAISDYHSIEIEGHLSDEGNTNTLVQSCCWRGSTGSPDWVLFVFGGRR